MKKIIIYFLFVAFAFGGRDTVTVDEYTGLLPSDSTFIELNVQPAIDSATNTIATDVSDLSDEIDEYYSFFIDNTNEVWIAVNLNGAYIDLLEDRADALEGQTNLLWTGIYIERTNRVAQIGLLSDDIDDLEDADEEMLFKYGVGTNALWGAVNANSGDITTLEGNVSSLNTQTNLLWAGLISESILRINGTNSLWGAILANEASRIAGTNELWGAAISNRNNLISFPSEGHIFTETNYFTDLAGYKVVDSISTNIQSIDFGPPVVTNYTYVTNYGYYSFADERDIESLESGTNALWYSIITNRDDIATLNTNKANITYVDSGTNMLWYSIITNRDDIAMLDTNKANITYVDELYSDIWTEAAGLGILTTNKSYVTEEGSAVYDFGTTQYFWEAESATGYMTETNLQYAIDNIVTNMGSIYVEFPTEYTNYAAIYGGIETNIHMLWDNTNKYVQVDNTNGTLYLEKSTNAWVWNLYSSKEGNTGDIRFLSSTYNSNTFTNSVYPPDGGLVYGETELKPDSGGTFLYDGTATIRQVSTNLPSLTTNWVVLVTTNITYSPLINQSELDDYATTADLATAATNANDYTDAEITDTFKNYYYGDTDISITPTNAFVFDGLGTITAYSGSYADIVIPYEINGVTVKSIGDDVFGGDIFTADTTIATIVAGINLKNIGDDFCYNCDALASVKLSAVTNVGDAFLFDSDLIDLIELPEVTSIGINFSGLDTLNEIRLPKISSVGNGFLQDCPLLTNVSFSVSPPATGTGTYTGTPNITNYVTNPTATGWGTTLGGMPVVRSDVYAGDVIATGTITGSNLSGSNTGDQDLTDYATTSDLATAETNAYDYTDAKLANYVPYTGATNDVDLGANDLIVDTDTLYVDSTSGNVGIGTTSPSYPLHVAGSGIKVFKVESTDGSADVRVDTRATANNKYGYYLFQDKGTTKYAFAYRQSDGDFYIFDYANAKTKLRADQSTNNLYLQENGGNVGIGTTTPSEKLEVDGNILASGTITGSNLSGTNTGDQDLTPYAKKFVEQTEVSGTTINLSTNQIAYSVNITNDTTFILDNTVTNVSGALMLRVGIDELFDVTWSNATLARNIEYATNTVYNFSCFFDSEQWNIIPISGRAK